jgi:hypothetical protein
MRREVRCLQIKGPSSGEDWDRQVCQGAPRRGQTRHANDVPGREDIERISEYIRARFRSFFIYYAPKS